MDQSAIVENPVQFASGGRMLVGRTYHPRAGVASPAVVICDAFGDERRSSCLAMVRLARAIAASGFPVLRFDYGGCGDSTGKSVDVTPGTMMTDISTAITMAAPQPGRAKMCLLGLRVGATLAAEVAGRTAQVSRLVLLEPVRDAATYFKEQVKRNRVRQMITGGQGQSTGSRSDDTLDLDGLPMRRSTLAEFETLRIAPQQAHSPSQILMIQISFNDRLKPDIAAVRDAYTAAGAKVELQTLVMPPFWSRVDIVDTDPLNEAIVGWLGNGGR